MPKYTFEEICKTIKTDDGLKLKDRLHFHCFNENGAVNAKDLADKRIDEAVDAGICKSGAILAYGGFSNYAADKLMKMTRNKRVIRRELNIFPGDIFNREMLIRSQSNLARLNYFANVLPDVAPVDEDEVENQNTGDEDEEREIKEKINSNLSGGFIRDGAVQNFNYYNECES